MSRGLTDEQYAEQQARIEQMFNRWVDVLGLSQWSIYMKLDATGELMAEYGESADSPTTSLMDVGVSWEYMRAQIRINAIAAASMSDDEVEESLVHELCHMLVCEMRPNDRTEEDHRHEERVATMISRAFIRVRSCDVREEVPQP